jgi:hypothetical protein
MAFFLSLLVFLLEWSRLEEVEIVLVEQYFIHSSPLLDKALDNIISHHYNNTWIAYYKGGAPHSYEGCTGDLCELAYHLEYYGKLCDAIFEHSYEVITNPSFNMSDKSTKRLMEVYIYIIRIYISTEHHDSEIWLEIVRSYVTGMFSDWKDSFVRNHANIIDKNPFKTLLYGN